MRLTVRRQNSVNINGGPRRVLLMKNLPLYSWMELDKDNGSWIFVVDELIGYPARLWSIIVLHACRRRIHIKAQQWKENKKIKKQGLRSLPKYFGILRVKKIHYCSVNEPQPSDGHSSCPKKKKKTVPLMLKNQRLIFQ